MSDSITKPKPTVDPTGEDPHLADNPLKKPIKPPHVPPADNPLKKPIKPPQVPPPWAIEHDPGDGPGDHATKEPPEHEKSVGEKIGEAIANEKMEKLAAEARAAKAIWDAIHSTPSPSPNKLLLGVNPLDVSATKEALLRSLTPEESRRSPTIEVHIHIHEH